VPRPPASSREAILEATLEVVRERGYEGATIPAIAARCGISRGTVYNYFPSKEQLLFACARAGGTPGDVFERLAAQVGRRPVAALLQEAAVALVRFLELRLPALLVRAARARAADRRGAARPRRGLEAARDYFAAEMRAGRIRRADPEALALGFVGGLFYASFFERLYGLPRSFARDREGFARSWAREFARGLAAPARRAGGGGSA
jgi:AcrR family transcriptional regulator